MVTLTDQQGRAVNTVVSSIRDQNPLTTLFGFAGTGKSTILPNVIADLGFDPVTVQFVAPTGKAAKVMRAKLRAQGMTNVNASTIHSAIYRAKPAPIATLEGEMYDLQVRQQELIEGGEARDSKEVLRLQKLIDRLKMELDAAYTEEKVSFQLNLDSPVQMAQLIVVDEASMVGGRMADDLMSFGVPIFAMGDPGQLPPIEDDGGICARKPDAFLTEIHRQAADNPIIHLATLARQGEDLPFGDYDGRARVMRRKDFDPDLDPTDLPKFICGTNKSRWKINQNLREDFGIVSRAGDRVGPQSGEPLIVTKNNKQYPELVNGVEATCTFDSDLVRGAPTMRLDFESEDGIEYREKTVFQGRFEEHFERRANAFSCDSRTAYRARRNSIEMDFAYCITGHKSQGSQWDRVVVIDESSVFREDEDKWLYTAITRAAEDLTILR